MKAYIIVVSLLLLSTWVKLLWVWRGDAPLRVLRHEAVDAVLQAMIIVWGVALYLEI